MKEVILAPTTTISLDNVDIKNTPIFVKENGKFIGMIINQAKSAETEDKWIIRVGGKFGATGYFKTIQECIKSGIKLNNYTYFIED